MEYFLFFLKGLVIGLIVGFPSGPVGFIYIKRATTDGFWAGFISGLGSTVAHILYVIAILFGYVKIVEEYGEYENYLTLACAILLIIIGIFIFKRKKKNEEKNNSEENPYAMFGYFVSAGGITATNPMEIIQFTFLFSVFNIFNNTNINYSLFIFGIILGSLFWPVITSLYLGKMSKHLSSRKITYIQKFSGIVIVFIGIIFVIKGLL